MAAEEEMVVPVAGGATVDARPRRAPLSSFFLSLSLPSREEMRGSDFVASTLSPLAGPLSPSPFPLHLTRAYDMWTLPVRTDEKGQKQSLL
jgi:hypothetical protein